MRSIKLKSGEQIRYGYEKKREDTVHEMEKIELNELQKEQIIWVVAFTWGMISRAEYASERKIMLPLLKEVLKSIKADIAL